MIIIYYSLYSFKCSNDNVSLYKHCLRRACLAKRCPRRACRSQTAAVKSCPAKSRQSDPCCAGWLDLSHLDPCMTGVIFCSILAILVSLAHHLASSSSLILTDYSRWCSKPFTSTKMMIHSIIHSTSPFKLARSCLLTKSTNSLMLCCRMFEWICGRASSPVLRRGRRPLHAIRHHLVVVRQLWCHV